MFRISTATANKTNSKTRLSLTVVLWFFLSFLQHLSQGHLTAWRVPQGQLMNRDPATSSLTCKQLRTSTCFVSGWEADRVCQKHRLLLFLLPFPFPAPLGLFMALSPQLHFQLHEKISHNICRRWLELWWFYLSCFNKKGETSMFKIYEKGLNLNSQDPELQFFLENFTGPFCVLCWIRGPPYCCMTPASLSTLAITLLPHKVTFWGMES